MRRILLAIPIVAALVAVIVSAHGYLIDRLAIQPRWPAPWSALIEWSVIVLGVTLVAQPLGERLLRPALARWIAWPASLWMGFAFLLLVALAVSDGVLWLGVGVARAAGVMGPAIGADGGVTTDRWRVAGVAAIVLLAGGRALYVGLSRPVVRRVAFELARWPKALDGFRIVQISDIHIGPILDRRFAAELTRRVNALDPDLVAVTGDLVDGRVALLRDEVAPFAQLRGRLGVWFVTGNHDHYSGARAWAEEAGRLGMRVLRNASAIVVDEPSGVRFAVAGVDDHRSGMLPGESGEDLDAALADVPRELPVVLLAHDPSTFKRASGRGVDLQLSGHTHGGQIWPFRYVVRLAIPFVAGCYRRGDAQLYVSRGTGFWGPPMRLGAPAEITEIVLRSS